VSTYTPFPAPPGYVTQTEAARRLGLSRMQITTLISRGEVEAYRDPRTTWFIAERSLTPAAVALATERSRWNHGYEHEYWRQRA
jgi:excisionase family DNA binding protein